jgi:hypothetical protein
MYLNHRSSEYGSLLADLSPRLYFSSLRTYGAPGMTALGVLFIILSIIGVIGIIYVLTHKEYFKDKKA